MAIPTYTTAQKCAFFDRLLSTYPDLFDGDSETAVNGADLVEECCWIASNLPPAEELDPEPQPPTP